ncbi:ADP-ribosylglycohydrolase family protein [Rhabdothermincola salaria]|uniref:ADP-ribosylglycohydrolase family protein n=1 Tax=Rhabdothermincola salaria TaxID=2903142 RepID=UPI001E63A691|nr:ADP-ribosylglycohydrolase family protein [Rhabdothermincola salaria]MCD9623934.1 ADP-ribosylglycohydrolase family protein [Rhabdothermincola salaria]
MSRIEGHSREDRSIGALLGLAAGDAVGTTVEFRAPGSFAPLTDMVGGGPFRLQLGEWTDDTSMALCMAESLVDCDELDLADHLRRYVLWRDQGYLASNGRCFDIGGTVAGQLRRFERTGEAVDPQPDEDAAANGSLMRLAPVPIRWHTDIAEAAERSGESSRSTHAATRPVDACRVLGAMTAALIGGMPAEEVLDPDFWSWGPLHPEIEAVARGSWRDRQPPQIRGTGYCVDALEAAIWAVAGAQDFADAVLRAANLGDDADTTAAIAGQLAGARWGASGIPADWRDVLALGSRITELGRQLHARGAGATPPVPWAHDDHHHAWWVEPGAVLAGEYPATRRGPVATRAKVDLLVDAGVHTFIDLTTPEDQLTLYAPVLAEVGTARGLDLEHVPVPIPDLDITTDAEYDRLVQLIGIHRERGVVYVHCWGGIGRTGTVIGCLLADQGHDFDSITTRLSDMRAGTRKAHRPAPETAEQVDVLRRRGR